MRSFVFGLSDIDKTNISIVGGKGANLGELMKIKDVHVPPGFCISTEVYKRILEETPVMNALIHQLSQLKLKDGTQIRKLSGEIRKLIEGIKIPPVISEDIIDYVEKLGANESYAIRSSATAEDLPTASFAGQQDTYLNVIGKEEILKHISKCWASLFTERAIMYRIQNGFDHRKIALSVIVQKMIFPNAAGVLFTADPITANRKVLSIDAGFGLGEALVSGLVNADNYKVRDGKIIDKKIANKKLAIHAVKDGGTKEQKIKTLQQNKQVLTNIQILQLEHIGRKIEEHFGSPQDIEWCLANDIFYIVQSRPVTTLFPIPEVKDKENHVYVSVGHQQMMTDAMKPLGLSFFLLTTRASMYKAGGRLFVDVAPMLATPEGRETMLNVLGKSDPIIKDALTTIIERGDFIKPLPDNKQEQRSDKNNQGPSLADYQTLKEYDPSIVYDLIKRHETSLSVLKQKIQTKTGRDLFEFILEDIAQFKKDLSDPQSFGVIMTAMNAASWINEKIEEWLGEKNVADILSQSVPNNVTSEMGLALLDVADVIRPYTEVINYLQDAKEDNFFEELVKYVGGEESSEAMHNYLNKYGMRCVGEIDITRTRWSEKPTMLVPLILSNIKNFEAGESKRRFEQGLHQALKKEQDLLDRLKELPNGEQKAQDTKQMISLVRNLAGFREYPKYSIVSRYFVYKEALLKEAEQLVQANIIHQKEDVYYLTFEEFYEVVGTGKLDYEIIGKRKDEYKFYEKLTPPRVMTSDGEIITGKYKPDNLPADAIAGLPISSGMIEGRARVILNMEDANLQEGDILVTRFTDPSWTPLFVSIKGLVTEVGGLMTHGAVIAREYGITAVVGVENATKLIKDGQRIRVHGTEGYVEML